MIETKKWRNLFVTSFGEVFCDVNLKHKFPLSKRYKIDKKTKEKVWEGYYSVQFPHSRKHFPVHRIVAELFITKPNPKFNVVDHINGCRADNRITNLRWCNAHLNAINRPPLGIRYKRFRKGWVSHIRCKQKRFRVGVFKTYSAAYIASKKFKENLFESELKKYLLTS